MRIQGSQQLGAVGLIAGQGKPGNEAQHRGTDTANTEQDICQRITALCARIEALNDRIAVFVRIG